MIVALDSGLFDLIFTDAWYVSLEPSSATHVSLETKQDFCFVSSSQSLQIGEFRTNKFQRFIDLLRIRMASSDMSLQFLERLLDYTNDAFNLDVVIDDKDQFTVGKDSIS